MPVLRRLLPDVLALLILFALPLLFFAPQTLGGYTLIPTENLYQYEPFASDRAQVGAPEVPHNHLVSDLILQNTPWKHFIRTQLAAGEIPLWNPHQFSGIPFLAAGQHSALYPLSIIYYVMPLPLAYGWFTVANLGLAGVFMYALAQGLGVRREAALLAGVIYQFSGFVIASVVFQMMIGGLPWLPLMLLMAEFIIRQRGVLGLPRATIPWVVIGAGALGMNILAGHVEITIYTLLITGFYSAARLLFALARQRDLRAVIGRGVWLLALVVLGFGLGAVQFIPLFDFAQTNFRAERSDFWQVLSFAHPPRDLLQFILPNFYGSPAHQHIFDVFSLQMVPVSGSAQPHTEWGIKNYVEGALYLGILPLILAALSLLLPRRQPGLSHPDAADAPPYRLIFGGLALLSLLFMFGTPLYALIYVLPGINQLNSPFRWVFGLTISVALLAAFGLDALWHLPEHRRRLVRRIGGGLALIGALLLIGLLLSRFAYPQIEGLVERLRTGLLNADRAFTDARSFYSYQVGNAAIFGVMLLLSGVLVWGASRLRTDGGRRLWAVVVAALVAVDLMAASWNFNPASDPALLDYAPPAVAYLQAQQAAGERYRFTTLQDPQRREILQANSGWLYNLEDIRGYDSIISRQYVDFMRGLAPQPQLDFNRVAPLYTTYLDASGAPYFDVDAALTSDRLDLLNVGYIVTHPEIDLGGVGFVRVYDDAAVSIWRNPEALPRAYLVGSDYDPAQIARPAAYTPAPIRRDTGREKLLDLSVPEGGGWLVVSETYAPGWRGFLRPLGAGEDAETPIEAQRVAGNFIGVPLPAGDYTLRLIYSPATFQVGIFGSVMGLIALTLLLGVWLWRAFVGVNTEDSSATARVARNSVAPILLNLFNRGIDFALAIVIYRLLSQTDVGIYRVAIVIFVWFDIFTNFGLDLYLIREVARDKLRGAYTLLNTSALRLGLSFAGLGVLLLLILGWQNAGQVEGVGSFTQEGVIALLLLYLGLFPASLNKGLSSLFYAHERAEVPEVIATITSINKAVFGVIVLLLGWGIIGLAAVSIVNNLITFGVLLWAGRGLLGRVTGWRPDRQALRTMTAEGWPLMLNHFLATIFFQFDVIILQALRGAVTVAQYSTVYQWLLAVDIIPAFFTRAVFPILSRQANEDPAAFVRLYRFGLKLLVALALPLAVLFYFLAEFLTLILAGAPYLPDAAIALQLIIWSIPLGWMNSLTQYALIALDLQRRITWAFAGAVVFNIVTNLLFIPQFGYQAAAITTIFSQAALLLPFALLLSRGLRRRGVVRGLRWWDMLWRPLIAAAAMGAVMAALWPLLPLLALIAGVAVYGGLLLALRPLSTEEIDALRPILPARLTRSRLARRVLGVS